MRAVEAAQKHKLVKVGDTVVFAGGVPLGIPGRTNMIRVCIVE
ncbi:pyruvate kinase alpha/beta domain-containing protein [Blautia sp. HCP3S3_D9]